MPKVLVSDSLSKDGLAALEGTEGLTVDYKPGLSEDELVEAIKGVNGLVIRSGSKVTAKVIAAADELKVVGRAGIGVDNVDVPEASRRGIIVMNTPTGNAVTTAEHAISLLMSIARKIPFASAAMKEGKWEKKKCQGIELAGKTLGVIGLGNIGRIVAERASGLHMKIVGFDPVVTKERAAELGIELVTLDELFARADAITVHTPLNKHTQGLVNDDTIAKMKDGVLLVNAARGGIYEEDALIRGLESGKIAGVAIDVYVEEPPGLTDLIKHPLVVATPHLGASTTEAQQRVAVEIAQQVAAYLTTGEISNSLNVPAIPAELAPVLGPYQRLASALGEFLAQVSDIEPIGIEIGAEGEAATLSLAPIVNAALAGLLDKFLEAPVNAVNAPLVAKDRGIEVSENKSTATGEFSTLVSLTVKGKGGTSVSVAGTLAADGTARLVRWGALEMEAHLDGAMLVLRNADRPGVIGRIGTLLGESGINVSRMQVGLDASAKEAASLWAIDGKLPSDLVENVRASDNVNQAFAVRIG